MVDKQPFIDKLLDIIEREMLSLCELAKELDLRYITVKYLLDPDNKDLIREATARKIQAFINKYSKDKNGIQ